MATTRFWKITTKINRVIDYVNNEEKTKELPEDILNTLHYATNEKKTLTEEKLYVTGVNCDVKTAAVEFKIIKDYYCKGYDILGYHGYMSFVKDEVTPDEAHAIGVEFAKRNFPGFQVVVATHLNTGIIHNHFVVNSVSAEDGHMAHDEVQWFKFHHLVDRIMKEHSLSYIKNPRRMKEPDMRQRYISQKYDSIHMKLIKEAVDAAIAESKTLEEMRQALKRMGYQYNLSPNRKYWTVTPKGGTKNFRLYHLGPEYTNQAIQKRLAENIFKKTDNKPVKKLSIVQYTGSLFMVVRLYKHYKYVLDTINRNRERTRYLPHYVRADVEHLQKISEEIRFMERENIETMSELKSYEDKLQAEMESLVIERRKIYRQKAKVEPVIANELAKEQASITETLAKKRTELNMCKDIMKRSEKMISLTSGEMSERSDDEHRSRNSNSSRWRDSKNRV